MLFFDNALGKLLNVCLWNKLDHKCVSIFKVPAKTTKEQADWRAKLLGKIIKDRQVDSNQMNEYADGSLHICEKHYTYDCIRTCKQHQNTLGFYF